MKVVVLVGKLAKIVQFILSFEREMTYADSKDELSSHVMPTCASVTALTTKDVGGLKKQFAVSKLVLGLSAVVISI